MTSTMNMDLLGDINEAGIAAIATDVNIQVSGYRAQKIKVTDIW